MSFKVTFVGVFPESCTFSSEGVDNGWTLVYLFSKNEVYHADCGHKMNDFTQYDTV